MHKYLSPKVKQLVNLFNQASLGKNSLTLESKEQKWKDIVEELSHEAGRDGTSWYEKGAVAFGMFCEWSSQAMASRERKIGFGPEWTSRPELFSVRSPGDDPAMILEMLLGRCACLERSLGDLYFTANPGTPVPSLLRDLVTSEMVSNCLGQELAAILEAAFGGPRSLNMRNLAWHGFLLPGDVHRNCVDGLAMIAHLAEGELKARGIIVRKRPLRRPTEVDLPPLDEGMIFASLPPQQAESRTAIVERCRANFENGLFFEAALLALPELELLLRVAFAEANGCPERTLTAESDALYTTMTEVLDRRLGEEGKEKNKLVTEMQPRLLSLLLDLFVMPEGPRIRDRISHGEIETATEASEMRNWAVAVAVAFGAVCEHLQKSERRPFHDVLAIARPMFHPCALLLQELKGASQRGFALFNRDFRFLTELDLTEEGLESSFRHWSVFHLRPAKRKSHSIIRNSQRPPNAADNREEVTLKFFSAFVVADVHRPRTELACITTLRSVATNVGNFFSQATETAAAREIELEGGCMGRRRADSYRKMLTCLGRVSGFLFDSLATAAALLVVFKENSGWCEEGGRGRDLGKKLKRLLCCCENLVSCTAQEKNDWSRAEAIVEGEGTEVLGRLDDFVKESM